MSGELRVIPLRGIPELEEGDDLGALLADASARTGGLEGDDVVVVAQKAVSKVEGRVVHLGGVEPSQEALELAGDSDPRRTEMILREARDRAHEGTARHRRDAARLRRARPAWTLNAKGPDTLALLPLDPDASAASLREQLRELTGAEVGVVVSDSFGRAWRLGTTDVALGVAGIAAILDLDGQLDGAGYELHATQIQPPTRSQGRPSS